MKYSFLMGILTLFLCLNNSSYGQSFQRMAISKGAYKLLPNGSSKVTAYCLDYSRKAPRSGMDYGNILSGGSQAVVELTTSTGGVRTMTLDEAVSRGMISIEGNNINAFEGKGKEILQEMLPGMDASNRQQARFLIDNWDEMTMSERREVEEQLTMRVAEAHGYRAGELGDHKALKFINNTDQQLEIKLKENIQLGSESEVNKLMNVSDLELSSNPKLQDDIQRGVVWKNREEEHLKQLKQLGFYDGKTTLKKDDLDDVKKIYKRIQKEHNIRNSGDDFGVFDEKMEAWVKEQRKLLSNDLKELGFDGSLKQAIESYQKFKGTKITGSLTESLKKTLKADLEKGIYVGKNGRLYQLKFIEQAGVQTRVLEVRKNLYLREDYKYKVAEIEKRLANRRYLQEEIEVISLVVDDATQRTLKQQFPNHHLSFDLPSMRNLMERLRSSKNKSVFVLGHMEGNRFVTRVNGVEKFSISIKDLKWLADEMEVNIFHMGCNSANYGTGVANTFYSVDALKRLGPAVQKNSTVMDLLENLAGDDLKLFIDKVPFGDRGYVRMRVHEEQMDGGALLLGAAIGTVIVYAAVSDDETEETPMNKEETLEEKNEK